ncbi:MAG: DEAD/DEAH box helicase [Bacteroidia bacterium]|nr:DEAD/DEAH box helicase [Bacteroidia bacterium]
MSNSLLKALADQKFVNPTPIQEKAFPVVMSGKDVIGIAQTGTGKTLAYLLPILRQHTFSKQKDPRILILVPTRELVIQVLEEIRKLTTYMSVRVVGVYGGTNINNQKQLLYDGLDILVATPGRLVDLSMTGLLRMKSIQKLVIDEVDEMLNLGFRPQLISLMEIIPAKRQNLMFSATLTEDVSRLISDFFSNTCKIEVAAHGTPIEKITQLVYHVPNYFTKVNLLELLLAENEEYSRVLVFVSTKKTADRLFETIDAKFPGQIGVLHSNKSQNFRINALKQFEEGIYRILVTTDLIARGLDISDVTHVINFEMAETAGDYINRMGRTGRADKAGAVISFVTEKEKAYQIEVEALMKRPVPVEPLPANLVISGVFTEKESPTNLFDKNYHKSYSLKDSQGAFHEKKEKNKKVNLGGPGTRNPKFGKQKKQPVPIIKPPKFKF